MSNKQQRAAKFGRIMDDVDGDWRIPAWIEAIALRIYIWCGR